MTSPRARATLRVALIFLVLAATALAGCTGSGPDDDQGVRDADGDSNTADAGDATDDGSSAGSGTAGGTASFRLAIGDTWTHTSERRGVTSTVVSRVDGIETVSYAGGPHEAYRIMQDVRADDAAGGMGGDSSTTTWTRTDDHALLRTHFESSVMGQSFESDTRFQSPCQQYQWPLTVAATWTTTCTTVDENGSPTGSTTTTFTVETQEAVTVAAGTFDAFRIRQESGTTVTTIWHAAAGCGMVKSETPDGQGGVVVMQLQSYDC